MATKMAYREPAFDDETPSDEVEVRIDGLIPHPAAPGMFTLKGVRITNIDPQELDRMLAVGLDTGVMSMEELDPLRDRIIRALVSTRLARVLAERVEVLP